MKFDFSFFDKRKFSKSVSLLRAHKHLIVLLFIQAVVFHGWVFRNALFTFGDVGVWMPETQRELLTNVFSLFSSDSSFGNVNIATSSNPFLLFFGIFAYFGIGYSWSMKLLILFPTIFGVVLSSYLLIRKLTQSKQAAFFGALIYSYNAYFLVTLTGALYISLAYALSPFALLAFVMVIESPTIRRKIILALTLGIIGYIEFRALYINLLILALYFSCFLVLKKESFQEKMKHIKAFVLPGVIFFLINFFWILPLFVTGKISDNELFSRGLFGDSYFDIVNAFAVFHPWWTGEVPSIFVKQTAPWYFFIITIAVIITLFISKKAKVLPFFLIFVVGVLLTKQSAVPFQDLYLWLYNHIPGFNAFRESSKFFLMSSLSIAVLVGYFLSSIEAKGRRVLLVFCQAVFFFLVFNQAKPVTGMELGTLFIPREVPKEYQELNDFFREKDGHFRILQFPHSNRFVEYSNNHPSISLLGNMDSSFKEFIDRRRKDFVRTLYSPFEDRRFLSYLGNASVRYIVIPSNLKWDDVDSPWRDSSNYTEKLNRISALKKISDEHFESKGMFIYENQLFQPLVFLSKNTLRYYDVSDRQGTYFQMIRPTEYEVLIKNVDKPFYVNFATSYHPDWKIRIGSLTWHDRFWPKNFLSSRDHIQNEFKMNSFYVDPAVIRSDFPGGFTENKDGSIDFRLTLYFQSQSYFLFGIFVSATTIVLCLLYFCYNVVFERNKS